MREGGQNEGKKEKAKTIARFSLKAPSFLSTDEGTKRLVGANCGLQRRRGGGHEWRNTYRVIVGRLCGGRGGGGGVVNDVELVDVGSVEGVVGYNDA